MAAKAPEGDRAKRAERAAKTATATRRDPGQPWPRDGSALGVGDTAGTVSVLRGLWNGGNGGNRGNGRRLRLDPLQALGVLA